MRGSHFYPHAFDLIHPPLKNDACTKIILAVIASALLRHLFTKRLNLFFGPTAVSGVLLGFLPALCRKFPLARVGVCEQLSRAMIPRNSQLFLLYFVVFAFARPLFASEMVVGNIRVIRVQGASAEMIDPTGKKSAVLEGVFIRQGTKIITGPDSRVDLVFENGSAVNIGPSSKFSIDEFVQDPFNSDALDYSDVEQAPTTSVTKIAVPDGDIIFDVAKQKTGSTFEITTPVGTAGIRGTSGFAGGRGFGLATGSASFRTPAGNNVNVAAGNQVSPNGASSLASLASLNSVNSVISAMRTTTPAFTFLGSPPNLAPQQQNALDAAASRSGDSIAETAAKLSAARPESASDIAEAASLMFPAKASAIAASVVEQVPSAAIQIASSVARVAPGAAAQVAALVAQVVPASAPEIAAAVARVNPTAAPEIATSVTQVVPNDAPRIAAFVSQAVPSLAPQVAAAVAQVVPTLAPEIAASVAQIVPDNAAAVAKSVSQAVPQQSQNISDSVIAAVPTADAVAIQQAANQGALESTQPGGGDAAQTGVSEKPQPSNNPIPPPPPPPQATPQATPPQATPTPNPSNP